MAAKERSLRKRLKQLLWCDLPLYRAEGRWSDYYNNLANAIRELDSLRRESP
jgi:hypothetical protein